MSRVELVYPTHQEKAYLTALSEMRGVSKSSIFKNALNQHIKSLSERDLKEIRDRVKSKYSY